MRILKISCFNKINSGKMCHLTCFIATNKEKRKFQTRFLYEKFILRLISTYMIKLKIEFDQNKRLVYEYV